MDNCILRAEQILLTLVVCSVTTESGPCSTHCFHERKQAAQEGFDYITFSSEFNWEILREREYNIFNQGKILHPSDSTSLTVPHILDLWQ